MSWGFRVVVEYEGLQGITMDAFGTWIKQVSKEVRAQIALDLAEDFLSQLDEMELAELAARYDKKIGDN